MTFNASKSNLFRNGEREKINDCKIKAYAHARKLLIYECQSYDTRSKNDTSNVLATIWSEAIKEADEKTTGQLPTTLKLVQDC